MTEDDSFFSKITDWFKKHFTIFVIWIVIGMCIGFGISKQLYKQRMDEAIKLGGLIHKNIVYDIKLRP